MSKYTDLICTGLYRPGNRIDYSLLHFKGKHYYANMKMLISGPLLDKFPETF